LNTTFICAVSDIIQHFLSHAHSYTQQKLMTSYVPWAALPLTFSQIYAILDQKFPR